MSFWEDLGNFACNCVFFVGNVITDVALTVAEYIQKSTGADTIPNIQRQRIDIKRGLHELNLELLDLRRKWFRDGRLSNNDKDRDRELREKRNETKNALWNLNEAENAEKIQNNPDAVTSTVITPEKPHILQYHIGQIAKNKKCPIKGCDYPMVLNFKRGADTVSVESLFWTCTKNNFIRNRQQWHPVRPYQHSDSNIFTNDKIDEFECTSEDLTIIFRAERKDILLRIDQYRDQSVNSHICPMHGGELVLRKNRNAANLGALEKYFLSCPYYNSKDPYGPDSCRYKVTLKSPAQLAAALKSFGDKGIL